MIERLGNLELSRLPTYFSQGTENKVELKLLKSLTLIEDMTVSNAGERLLQHEAAGGGVPAKEDGLRG